MESVSYTGRQLNSTCAAVHFFNMAVLCQLEQKEVLVSSMSKCYDSVEVAYAYNEEAPLGK